MSSATETRRESNIERSTARLQWRTALLSFVTGVVLTTSTIGSAAYWWVNSMLGPRAEITSPGHQSTPASFVVAGKSKGIPADEELWAVKFNHDNGKWYPEKEPCAKLDGGEFNCGRMYLGRKSQGIRGTVYDIYILSVDAGAASEFNRYYRETVDKDPLHPDYAGMETLPAGVRFLAQSKVTRSS